MGSYPVLERLDHNGKSYGPGDIVEIDDADTAYDLLIVGVIGAEGETAISSSTIVSADLFAAEPLADGNFPVLERLDHDGETYEPGDTVVITDAVVATELQLAGAIGGGPVAAEVVDDEDDDEPFIDTPPAPTPAADVTPSATEPAPTPAADETPPATEPAPAPATDPAAPAGGEVVAPAGGEAGATAEAKPATEAVPASTPTPSVESAPAKRTVKKGAAKPAAAPKS